jgi:hypothetical protein
MSLLRNEGVGGQTDASKASVRPLQSLPQAQGALDGTSMLPMLKDFQVRILRELHHLWHRKVSK